jgi:hypothetical protein
MKCTKKYDRHGGRKPIATKEQLLKAIDGSYGVISTVAKRLKCRWLTAQQNIKKYPETLAALADEKEKMLDQCETTLITAIKKGDTKSAKWVLNMQGRDRGYTDKREIDLTSGGKALPVTIKIQPVSPGSISESDPGQPVSPGSIPDPGQMDVLYKA